LIKFCARTLKADDRKRKTAVYFLKLRAPKAMSSRPAIDARRVRRACHLRIACYAIDC
jgi:hypothetical protein